MIHNIPRFPDIFQKTHSLVGVFRVSSLMEAEMAIKIASTEFLPLLLRLDFSDGSLDIGAVRYLEQYIKSQGGLIGLVSRPTQSLSQAKEILKSGVSMVSLDVSRMSPGEAREQAKYIAGLAHSQAKHCEIIAGSLTKDSWNSPFHSLFEMVPFLEEIQPDVVGFHLPSLMQHMSTAGACSQKGDVIREVVRQTSLSVTLYGGWVGATGLHQSRRQLLQEDYQAKQGIGEHQCMKFAERGVKYISIDKDPPYLLDAAFRSIGNNTKSRMDMNSLRVAQSQYLQDFFKYQYKLFSSTYELS